MNVKAVEGGCSSVCTGGICNLERIAACAGSRSDVSMSANVGVGASIVGTGDEALEGADFSRLSQAAFSSSRLFDC